MQHLLLSQRHQKLPYPQRNGYNPFPMTLGVALNNLPGCAAAGTADGQFTSTGYVPPLQSAQFTAPQSCRDCQRVVRPIQNRFVLNCPHQFTHFILLRNMLHLFLDMLLADTVRWVERNDVVFLSILQHRGNCFEVLLHRSFLDAFSAPSGALAQFLAHFFKRHREEFCKRNTANQRVDNIQIAFVPCISGSLKERFLPLEPVLGVLFKMGLVTFFNAILELLLDALGFGHDILLDATLRYA